MSERFTITRVKLGFGSFAQGSPDNEVRDEKKVDAKEQKSLLRTEKKEP